MQRTKDDRWILSATDLVDFLACQHLSALDRAAELRQIPAAPRYPDPSLDALRARGARHETDYLETHAGAHVVTVEDPPREIDGRRLTWSERCAIGASRTVEALRAGADVVYQAWLYDGLWSGRSDFLVRVEEPSHLGDWSYEVVDTKLARSAKGGAVLQILLYSDLLGKVQGRMPKYAHLALGGPDAHEESFRVTDYAAYYRQVGGLYLAWHAAPHADAGDLVVAPDPVEHCALCDWRGRCQDQRVGVDHLSLVAGITRRQRDGLRAAGVNTLESLAVHPLPPAGRIDGLSDAPLKRVREQARVQLRGRREKRPVHELLLPLEDGIGLAALPAPSDGDLFLDLEGAPFALTHGLEFLFGWSDRAGNYVARWATDRAGEKVAFEEFVDLVMARRQAWPEMHVYHYASYERTALSKLMGFHGTREDEVDAVLRGGVLVDLYRVVRQGLRASVESYSIKKMEPFYGYGRGVELLEATRALVAFNVWLELGGERDADLEARIEGYNRDDVISTVHLRDWLESLRDEAERAEGRTIARPTPSDGDPGEEATRRNAEVDALVARLLTDVPADETARSPEQHAHWLMAQMLEFHRREAKSFWWEYYRCIGLGDEETVEDGSALGGLEHQGIIGTEKQSNIHRYSFPAQEHKLRPGKRVVDPRSERSEESIPGPGMVVNIDDDNGTIDLKRGLRSAAPHPLSLVLKDHVSDNELRQSLMRLGESLARHGAGDDSPFGAAMDLLLRRPPRVGQPDGAPLIADGEEELAAAVRLAAALDHGVLPIQGPPGAGKTHTAAHLIVHALDAGRRVGITATSHKVISNLLSKVCEVAGELGLDFRGVQQGGGEDACANEHIASPSTEGVSAMLAAGEATLAAGTAWLWSREEMIQSVDLLVIDEAGQFSLANALAVTPAATSLVLVGDPQQLDQPMQGAHPPGVNVSCLEHLLAGAHTIPPERGLFLGHTWRLHPDIRRFSSEIFYDGRLEGKEGLEKQRVAGAGTLVGTGLRLVPVAHYGNSTESPEEVEAVVGIVEGLTQDHTWTDKHGCSRAVTLEDVLVVAPYNVQVAALKKALPGARVGTVDKFQGQEAPVVVYSMTASSADDAPRGMDFLYSPNRLNVATSRARCLAIVVAAPAIFTPQCRTPAQMKLANAFCRFAELALPAPLPATALGDR